MEYKPTCDHFEQIVLRTKGEGASIDFDGAEYSIGSLSQFLFELWIPRSLVCIFKSYFGNWEDWVDQLECGVCVCDIG